RAAARKSESRPTDPTGVGAFNPAAAIEEPKAKPKPARIKAPAAAPVSTPVPATAQEPKPRRQKPHAPQHAARPSPHTETQGTPSAPAAARSRKPLFIAGGAGLVALVIVAVMIFSGGGTNTPSPNGDNNTGNNSQANAQTSNPNNTPANNTPAAGTGNNTTVGATEGTVKIDGLQSVSIKPVNVGAATNRTADLAIPADVKFAIEPATRISAADAATVAGELAKVPELLPAGETQNVAKWMTAVAYAVAGDKAKAKAALPAGSPPLSRALVEVELGAAYLRAGNRPAAQAAAQDALAAAKEPVPPGQRGPDARLVLSSLADLYRQLGLDTSPVDALTGPVNPRDAGQAQLLSLQASLVRGDAADAMKIAQTMPAAERRPFLFWLAQKQEDRDDKPAAAALYFMSLRDQQTERDPASDGRFSFDYLTHGAIAGLIRCGARSAAIDQVLAISPRQERRQAYLEMVVRMLCEQGDFAAAITAATLGGNLMLTAEAQMEAGLRADAAESLRRVLAALPSSPPVSPDPRVQMAAPQQRTQLLRTLAQLQIKAGDGAGAAATLDRLTADWPLAPKADGYVQNSATYQWTYRNAAQLYAAAGRLDKATERLDSVVALNKWNAQGLMKNNPRADVAAFTPTEGPDRATSLVLGEYAAFLYRANRKEEAAAHFDKAIAMELEAVEAARLARPANAFRIPNDRGPMSYMLLIGKARVESGDIAGLIAMYQRPKVAALGSYNGNSPMGELLDAAESVAITLAKGNQFALALQVADNHHDARMTIAGICREKSDHAGVLRSLVFNRLGMEGDSDDAATTPLLRWLAEAGAKADLAVVQEYVEAANGYGLRLIAIARAEGGDRAGARKLLEQGLEQAAMQDRQMRQVQLVGALRKIGEAEFADVVQKVIDESPSKFGGVIYGGDGPIDGHDNGAVMRVTLADLSSAVRAGQNAQSQEKRNHCVEAIQIAGMLIQPARTEYDPRYFRGSGQNAGMIQQIERRWANMERPPAQLATDAAQGPDRMVKLARELIEYRRQTQYAIPTSLQDLATVRKLDLAGLTDNDAGSIELVQGLPLDSGPQVVLLIDKKKRPGGLNAVVTVPGLVEQLTDGELAKRLANPPKPLGDTLRDRTYPPSTRWAAYGEVPIVVDRRVSEPARPPGPLDPFVTIEGAARDETANLYNFGATLRAYAKAHDGKLPATIDDLKKSGYLIHEEDINHPQGETYSYAIVPGFTMIFGHDAPIAIDTVPQLRRYGAIGGPNEALSFGFRYVTASGEINYGDTNHRAAGKGVPPLRTLKIEQADPVHIKARKQMINLRTVLQKYADKNGGKFPDDLMDLVRQGYLPDDSGLRSAVDPKVGFSYSPGQTTQSEMGTVLFYDPASCNYPSRNVLLAAHVGCDVMYYPELDQMFSHVKPLRFKPLVFGGAQAAAANNRSVEWNVPWAGSPAPKNHPFSKICDEVYEITGGGKTITIGVALGPAFERPSDEVFQGFLQRAQQNLTNFLQLPDSWQLAIMDGSRTAPDERFRKIIRRSHIMKGDNSFVFVRGEGDRCVAYWYDGPAEDSQVLENALGKVTFKARDSSKWNALLPAKDWVNDLKVQAVWTVWEEFKPAKDHLLAGLCKEYRKPESRTLAGIALGPTTTGRDDDVYKRYIAEIKKEINTRMPGVVGTRNTSHKVDDDPKYQSQALRYYDIFSVSSNGFTLSAITGTERGHCVVYWIYTEQGKPLPNVYGAAMLLLGK
ncbi:MAG: hypothetical protein WD768_21235, partial [Phycisphaeraceae bacterium]